MSFLIRDLENWLVLPFFFQESRLLKTDSEVIAD